MKKKFQMPEKEAFRALYQPMSAEFARRASDTLASLKDNQTEDKPKMKKKLSLGLVLAIVLILAACAALALSNNVFGLFADRYGQDSGMNKLLKTLDANSAQSDVTRRVAAATDAPFEEAQFTLSQSYYDGENLYLAYTLKAAPHLYDYTWRPTKDDLQGMRKEIVYGANSTEKEPGMLMMGDEAFVQAMVQTAQEQGAAGAIAYSTYLSDGVYLAGTDKYLDLSSSDDSALQDGTQVGYKEFQTPLREEARNQDELTLDVYLYRHPIYHYYDGKDWYIGSGERTKTPLTFTIPRNAENTVTTFPFSAEYEKYAVSGTVQVNGIRIQLDVTIKSKDGGILAPEDNAEGSFCDYAVIAGGVTLDPISGSGWGLDSPECGFQYTFSLPEKNVDTLFVVPCYTSAEGRYVPREEEGIAVSLAAPDPTALPHY